eukprot:gene30844-35884_t
MPPGIFVANGVALPPDETYVTIAEPRMFFANGVALPPDESYVTIAETAMYRMLRYWLKGPKAGTLDVLIDGLPGAPDGISKSADGNFWVPCVVEYSATTLRIIRPKIVRSIIALINAVIPATPWGGVMKVSPTGEVLAFLNDPKGTNIAFASSVLEVGDRLYIGNVGQSYISYVNKADVGL